MGNRVVGGLVAGVLAVTAACSGATESDTDPQPFPASLPTVSSPSTAPEPDVVPGRTWSTREGGDFGRLDSLSAATASTCSVVVRGGRVVHSFGAGLEGSRQVYSMTKSVVGLLVAIAAGEDRLRLDDRVSRWVREWRGTASEDVTIRQVMANTSGRRWTYAIDYGQMIRSAPDKTRFAVELDQQHEPGTHWEYNNSAIQVLERVLRRATGSDVVAYAQARLFRPLGMARTQWGRDAAGNPTTYSGITSTCGDMARVGLLVARDGRWGRRQVVPRTGLEQLVGASSQQRNAAYGLLWWVNRPGRVVEIQRAAGFPSDRLPYRGRLASHAPQDTTWALGYGNQLLAVVPSRGVVAVRLGPRPSGPDQLTFASFTNAVLAGTG